MSVASIASSLTLDRYVCRFILIAKCYCFKSITTLGLLEANHMNEIV